MDVTLSISVEDLENQSEWNILGSSIPQQRSRISSAHACCFRQVFQIFENPENRGRAQKLNLLLDSHLRNVQGRKVITRPWGSHHVCGLMEGHIPGGSGATHITLQGPSGKILATILIPKGLHCQFLQLLVTQGFSFQT